MNIDRWICKDDFPYELLMREKTREKRKIDRGQLTGKPINTGKLRKYTRNLEFGKVRKSRMKKYIVLILGILLLIISFVWMILSETSTRPFLMLSAISGATIVEGIHRVRNK